MLKSTLKQRLRRFTQSIQGRLVALFVLLALGTAAVFLYGTQQLLHNGWQAYARPLVRDYATRLAADLGTPPSVERAAALARRLPITVRIDGPLVNFDSQPPRHRGRTVQPGDDEPNDGDNADGYAAPSWGLVRRTADGHRIVFGLAAPPDRLRPRLVGWVTLCVLLLLTALAYATVRRLLAPLRAIGAGVQAYGRGEFEQTIAVQRDDELGLLTRHINGMASNLSGMLQAQRTLLLAISHELRSPLTRARVNVELVEEGPARQALLRDLGEMRDLISSLLESERLARGPAALQTEATDLAALVRDVVAIHFEGQTSALQLQAGMAPVQADPARLRLLLRNLVDNALRHGAGSAPPEVFVRTEADGRIALGVRDHGAGVAPEQLAQLGQPFYRPDSARSRAGGGVGLGLYLCQRVAQAHGGVLRLRNATPGLEVSAVWAPVWTAAPAANAAAAARSSPR